MLITNANVITWENPNQVLENYAILIEKDKIKAIGPEADLLTAHPGEEKFDAHGQYVMPGNICAHTHFYGAYARGMAIPGAPAKDFSEILEKLWWPLDKALTSEDVRYSALVCLADAIRHGTTTLIDHHASPNAIAGSLDVIAQTIDETGVRADLCYEVTDRNGEKGAVEGIQENVRFIEYVNKNHPSNGRLAASFGLHASLTISEKTIKACREAIPSGAGFHIHVAEHPVDEYDSMQKYGMRVIDRLYKHGILGPQTIVAHAVHVDVKEIELLAETGTWVSHQPRSNMNNAVGLADIEAMMRAGVKVCLGNDGFSNAMWEDWKSAYLAHKLIRLDPRRMSATDIIQMAVYNNASLVNSRFHNTKTGIIQPGAEADLMFVDYHPYTPLTAGNLPWQMIFGFHDSMVTSTMVAGKFLMKNRELLTMDEEKITYEARKNAPAVWARYEKQF